jgi:hypothetical protein
MEANAYVRFSTDCDITQLCWHNSELETFILSTLFCNNTARITHKTLRGDRPQGTVRENARVALSSSRPRAWRLYCLLLSKPLAGERLYHALLRGVTGHRSSSLYRQSGVSRATGRFVRSLTLLRSTHCCSRILRVRLQVDRSDAEWSPTLGYASRSSLLAYLPLTSHTTFVYCLTSSQQVSGRQSRHLIAQPPTV